MPDKIKLEGFVDDDHIGPRPEVVIRPGDYVTVMIAELGVHYVVEEILTLDTPRKNHMMMALKPSLYAQQEAEQ